MHKHLMLEWIRHIGEGGPVSNAVRGNMEELYEWLKTMMGERHLYEESHDDYASVIVSEMRASMANLRDYTKDEWLSVMLSVIVEARKSADKLLPFNADEQNMARRNPTILAEMSKEYEHFAEGCEEGGPEWQKFTAKSELFRHRAIQRVHMMGQNRDWERVAEILGVTVKQLKAEHVDRRNERADMLGQMDKNWSVEEDENEEEQTTDDTSGPSEVYTDLHLEGL